MNNKAKYQKGNTSIIYIVIALIIVAGGFLWFSNQNKTVAPTTDNTMMTAEESTTTTTGDAQESEARVITVKGSPFKYDLSEIRVKKGERIRIEFINEEGMHDFVIDELDVRTEVINTGETDSVEFIADTVGTFEYYCSVGNHRAQGMVGSLIVEE